MTQKTINCEECRVEFTYEENPKFPRKYCLNCSAKKKKSFEANKKLYKNEYYDDEPEVEKIGATGTVTIGEKPKDNGFHLSPENVNLGAIDMTQQAGYKIEDSMKFMEIFKLMKRIILTGE